jgi:hypothetical protein
LGVPYGFPVSEVGEGGAEGVEGVPDGLAALVLFVPGTVVLADLLLQQLGVATQRLV